MSDGNIPNELTALKTEMQRDVEVERAEARSCEKKSEWIQVSERAREENRRENHNSD
jgi:hypothetical protein